MISPVAADFLSTIYLRARRTETDALALIDPTSLLEDSFLMIFLPELPKSRTR